MAELSARRVVAVAAVAGALVGGAVAGAVAVWSTGPKPAGAASSSGSSSSLTTAAVVRTTLTTPVQVGGSIGYAGSYTVAAPSGASAQQVERAQQAVSADEQALSADEEATAATSAVDDQQVSAAQTNVNAAGATLAADQATEAQDCAATEMTTSTTVATTSTPSTPSSGASSSGASSSGASSSGASSSACSQDAQKVSQDQSALTQAQQQLASAQSGAARDHEQSQAKIAADQTKLAGDQATLASEQQSAVNPGTTYTSLPTAGDVLDEDQAVYSLSNEPVPLLYGSIPAYRAFYAGMSDGTDVGELNNDLIALGYGTGLAPSNQYSTATAAAVKRWQAALGLPQTGRVPLGDVVFEPGPIRVTSVTAKVGQSVGGSAGGGAGGAGGGGGTVLTATSTTAIVTVDLPVTQENLVKPDDAVSVVLPEGSSTVGGHVQTVGTVATCPGGGGTGSGSPGAGSADQSPCQSGGSGGSSTPTVPVTITMDRTPPGANLDQAPVNVDITSQTADNVLAVPVNALLALKGGGFGVEVVTRTTSYLVGVTTGLYSDTLVQVSGPGITVGTRVEVPAS